VPTCQALIYPALDFALDDANAKSSKPGDNNGALLRGIERACKVGERCADKRQRPLFADTIEDFRVGRADRFQKFRWLH